MIESFQLTSNGVLFGVTWTNPLSDRIPDPVVLTGSSINPPNLQSVVVSSHIQQQGTSDFVERATFAVNKYWPQSRARTGVPRQLIFVVAGPDAGVSPNRFASFQTLMTQRGIEYWAVGIKDGASDTTVLRGLSYNSSTTAHYLSFVDTDFLNSTISSVVAQFCPQGNLCGSSCSGFCGCNTPDTCQCPTCTSSTCFNRTVKKSRFFFVLIFVL